MNDTTTRPTPHELNTWIARHNQRLHRIPLTRRVTYQLAIEKLRQTEAILAGWDDKPCPHDVVDHRSCGDCTDVHVPPDWQWRRHLKARYAGVCAGCDRPVRPGQELSQFVSVSGVAYVHRDGCRP